MPRPALYIQFVSTEVKVGVDSSSAKCFRARIHSSCPRHACLLSLAVFLGGDSTRRGIDGWKRFRDGVAP